MVKVLVIGASGLLGSRLCPYLEEQGFEVVTAGRSSRHMYEIKDIKSSEISKIIDDSKPNSIINLAAHTNVDKCEGVGLKDAYIANSMLPNVISREISCRIDKNIHFLHISTDQVYSGTGLHVEDVVAPINVYGLTKLAGELLVDKNTTCILRTNFYGKSFVGDRLSFSDWIINSLKQNAKVTFFKDVYFSALHISSLCEIIKIILNERIVGTYNAGCRDGISKAEFAIRLAQLLGLSMDSASIGNSSSIGFIAKRPLDMRMCVKKLELDLKITCPQVDGEILKTALEYSYA